MRLLHGSLFLLLISCSSEEKQPETVEQENQGLDPFAIDNDGDGISENDGDCDDGNAEINPNANEVCDDIDNDCDGKIDEEDDDLDTSSATKYYIDSDQDGYGNGNVAIWSCQPLAAHVLTVGDCDDEDASIHPDAPELCDEIDNDCDEDIDDADDNLADGTLYYEDFDVDGYGDPGMSILACIQPAGYILDNQDCDDTDPNINPTDGDNDGLTLCDADCDDTDPAVGATDFDGDGAIACIDDCDDMNPLLQRNDFDGDGLSTCDGDCNDFDPLILDIDEDGDGFSACFIDCDDSDPMISPLFDGDGDGVHVCMDCNDADATIGGFITGYMDGDQDGYGAFETALVCDLDADGDGIQEYTTTFGDCNDFDDLTYPGAAQNDSGALCLQDSDEDGYGAAGICLSFSLYDTGGDGWDQTSAIQVYIDGIWYQDLRLSKGQWEVQYHCFPSGSLLDIGYISGPQNIENAFAVYDAWGQIQYQSNVAPDRVDIAGGDLPIITLGLPDSGGTDGDDANSQLQ